MLKHYPIKLGKEVSGAIPMVAEECCEEKMVYPTVYLHWEEPYDLPKEGTITFQFKTVHESTSKREGQKPRFELELELKEIVSTKASQAKEDEDGEHAIDKMMREKMGE